MGCIPEITDEKYPKQGDFLNKKVEVCFWYGDKVYSGKIIRYDITEPGRTIILLDNGRVLLASECQYSPKL